jgi:hypothetical protein
LASERPIYLRSLKSRPGEYTDPSEEPSFLRDQEGSMTEQARLVSCPWRRYVRFSVRGLIVVVLVIGAWLGWIVRGARIQRDAVAAIEKDGGGVRYDWQYSNGVYLRGGKPRAPPWLVELIGVDFFGHVTDAGLSPSSTTTDAMTVHVGRLTRLGRLSLDQTSLTDAGLRHVKGLTELVFLDLSGTAVSDAGLEHLSGMTKLSNLGLRGCPVTDAGIQKLKQTLPNLKITR